MEFRHANQDGNAHLAGNQRQRICPSFRRQDLVSASKDGTIKLWRLTGRSLQEERSFKLNTNNGSQLALSPDGKTVAVAMRNTIFLCDLESTQRLNELGQDGVYKVRFSSDGTRLVSTGWDGKVKLWQVANGHCLWTSAHTRTSVDAAFFPDGKRLVTGAWEPKAILWDAASGRELAAFRGQLLGADSVAVSPDGQRVAMGAGEGCEVVHARWRAAAARCSHASLPAERGGEGGFPARRQNGDGRLSRGHSSLARAVLRRARYERKIGGREMRTLSHLHLKAAPM